MSDQATFYMPEAVSTVARDVDQLYYFIYWICVFFFALIVTVMTAFTIRYRRRSENDTTPRLTHNTPLEVAWSVGPLLIMVLMFYWGFETYMKMRVAPSNALEIQVTAQRWFYTFTYPDGTVTTGNLGIPVNEPVKVVMSSKDVIHGFYIPHFRQKMDVLPNRYTTTWFEATKVGKYPLFCTQYCGRAHSEMLGTVEVMERAKYEEWLSTGGVGDLSKLSLDKQGEAYYKARGCITCHSTDGSVKTGPSFKGIYGHETRLADGRTLTVDENYIRKSLMDPAADVVAGYQPVMPTFKGALKDEQVNALIAYIKSLP